MDDDNSNQAPSSPQPQNVHFGQTPPVSSVQPIQTPPPTTSQTSLNQPITTMQPPADKPKSNKKLIIFLMVVFVLLALGALTFVIQRGIKPIVQDVTENQTITDTSTPSPQPTTTEVSQSDVECEKFPEMLESCTPHSCQYTHLLTGELMTREIVGLTDGVCVYVEEMPNNGEMRCDFDQDTRLVSAQYYKNLASSESSGVEVSGELSTDSSTSTEITYTIDGEEVVNPLQIALDNGQCVVSGY